MRCEYDFAAELWLVEVDSGQVAQAISNVVINADQAMPEGRVLRISARNVTVDAEGVSVRYVVIKIADHGVGIPAAHLARIFEPYFTTKQKGSGLGLAVTYSVVKRHDGYIRVESNPGVGTTFRVYLPAADLAKVVVTLAAERGPIGHGRVLIMDDEEMVRQVAARALLEAGFETATAGDGAQAVQMYRAACEAGQPFDVAIMDLTVPGGMGGAVALRLLREIDPAVKAIVSSGYSDDPILAEYMVHGFAAAVSKPYAIEDLCRAVIDVLGQSD